MKSANILTFHSFKKLAAGVGVFLTFAAMSWAQTVTGTVTGIVTDQSGAVIPGAHVVAHNVDTGVDSNATSDSAGVYRASFLPIGKYEVSVDAAGFGKTSVPAFQLEALQTATFNLKLAAAGVSTTVNVSDAAPILNTNDATLSGTFTANTIQNFPLNGAHPSHAQSMESYVRYSFPFENFF